MKAHFYLLLLFPPALLSLGCSSSARYMTAYVDPDFAARRYDTISVHLLTNALDERKSLEEALAEELLDLGLVAYESGMIFTPTRTWDSTQVINHLRKSGISAAIRVYEVERWTVSSWVPEKQETTVTTKEKTSGETNKGETREESSEEKKTTTTVRTEKSGGYMKEQELRRFQVELVDVPSGRIAWTGSIQVEERDFDYLADRISRQLEKDLMIAVRE